MKNSIILIIVSVAALVVFQMCQQKPLKPDTNDDFLSGSIKIVADESFAPILNEEMYIFKYSFKEAKPELLYKPENEAMQLFLSDSVRVAVLARELRPDELRILQGRALPPKINRFALDAVTLIVNQASADTLSSVNEIKKLLNGQVKTDKSIVFDNANSSVINYLKEFSGNQKMQQKNLYALKSNVEVIKYVSAHPDAIGIISFTWLNDPDKSYADFVNKVKIVALKDEHSKTESKSYFKPSQETIALKQYPLIRSLYILNSTGKMGLGTGFASFLASPRGQRIVLKSGLLPDTIPPREISISKSIKL
jgi:phosphate transport system substrate-binding protein